MAETEDTAPDLHAPTVLQEPPAQPAESPASPAPAAKPRRGGLLGGVIGGVLAAGAGFGLAQYVPQGWPLAGTAALEDRLAAQTKEIEALKARLAALPAGPDAALTARVTALEDKAATPAAAADLGPVEGRIAALESRLAAIEAIPADGAAASPAALAALQAEVQALKAGGGAASALQAMADETEARLKAAEDKAAALESRTADMVAQARARTALGQLAAAVDSGAPFAGLLPDLGTLPEPLARQAATGVPTLPALRETFPEAARAALEAALEADMGATWSERIASFLRSQTGARSLAPREGGDPDAVLSRAEAALAAGDLAAALKELDALPEAGQTALAGWRAQAEARQAAVAALADVTARIDG